MLWKKMVSINEKDLWKENGIRLVPPFQHISYKELSMAGRKGTITSPHGSGEFLEYAA
jgi:hypothetical protein